MKEQPERGREGASIPGAGTHNSNREVSQDLGESQVSRDFGKGVGTWGRRAGSLQNVLPVGGGKGWETLS